MKALEQFVEYLHAGGQLLTFATCPILILLLDATADHLMESSAPEETLTEAEVRNSVAASKRFFGLVFVLCSDFGPCIAGLGRMPATMPLPGLYFFSSK